MFGESGISTIQGTSDQIVNGDIGTPNSHKSYVPVTQSEFPPIFLAGVAPIAITAVTGVYFIEGMRVPGRAANDSSPRRFWSSHFGRRYKSLLPILYHC